MWQGKKAQIKPIKRTQTKNDIKITKAGKKLFRPHNVREVN